MNIWNQLEKIRNKPEPARQAIALFIAIIITAIIVGIWIWLKTFPKALPTTTTETPSPAKILWNYINDLWE